MSSTDRRVRRVVSTLPTVSEADDRRHRGLGGVGRPRGDGPTGVMGSHRTPGTRVGPHTSGEGATVRYPVTPTTAAPHATTVVTTVVTVTVKVTTVDVAPRGTAVDTVRGALVGPVGRDV